MHTSRSFCPLAQLVAIPNALKLYNHLSQTKVATRHNAHQMLEIPYVASSLIKPFYIPSKRDHCFDFHSANQMGNSLPCPCSEHTREGVLVMTIDGSLLRLKKGIHAKEVVASHPGYRVVRCDSSKTVLWGSAELESNRLHFLVPADRARCRATFRKFWKVGESKGLVPPRSKWKDEESSLGSFVGSAEFRRMSWTPQLRTIPEVVSPPPAAFVVEGNCSMEKSPAPHKLSSMKLGVASSPMMVR